jgi:murein DD-endopeptidase MepM/ murein hydrolase activator NlpD
VISTWSDPVRQHRHLRHSGRVSTHYGHLASIDAKIPTRSHSRRIGQILGVEGSTGTSTGLHLHFQIESTTDRSTRCRSWPALPDCSCSTWEELPHLALAEFRTGATGAYLQTLRPVLLLVLLTR